MPNCGIRRLTIFMKKNRLVYMICLLLIALASCNDSPKEVEYFPFRENSSDDWGMISPTGKILFSDEFEEEPTCVQNGRFYVKNSDGYWELYTADKRPKQIGDTYEQAFVFDYDVTPVVKKNAKIIEFIDKNGKTKFTLDKINGKKVIALRRFCEGIAVFQLSDNTFGAINTSGKVVIEPNYVVLGNCSDGKFISIHKKYLDSDSGKISIIDKKGKIVHEFASSKYDDCGWGVREGLLAVQKDNGWGFINMNGDFVVRPSEKHRSIGILSNGYFTFYDGDNWGLKDVKGETHIRAKYEDLRFVSDKILVCSDGDECWFVNLQGDKIGNESFDNSYIDFYGNATIVKTGSNSYSFVDKSGNFIKGSPVIYDYDLKIADEVIRISHYEQEEPEEVYIDSISFDEDTLEYDSIYY